ncbi:MAG: zf-TFIIB domain-containing protein [Elusimicrobia bacterium]|nr:zf-TFIIB domain-containing protein [Elusimicrobiota bacterium]
MCVFHILEKVVTINGAEKFEIDEHGGRILKMNCPRCKKVLTDGIFGDVVYQKCGTCGGFWFDKNELKEVKKQKDWFKLDTVVAGATSKVSKGELKCPRCGETLHTIEYAHESGVKINVCSECEGLWLDSGELKAIHEVSATWLERLKEKAEEELTAVELFLIKIGKYSPQ